MHIDAFYNDVSASPQLMHIRAMFKASSPKWLHWVACRCKGYYTVKVEVNIFWLQRGNMPPGNTSHCDSCVSVRYVTRAQLQQFPLIIASAIALIRQLSLYFVYCDMQMCELLYKLLRVWHMWCKDANVIKKLAIKIYLLMVRWLHASLHV